MSVRSRVQNRRPELVLPRAGVLRLRNRLPPAGIVSTGDSSNLTGSSFTGMLATAASVLSSSSPGDPGEAAGTSSVRDLSVAGTVSFVGSPALLHLTGAHFGITVAPVSLVVGAVEVLRGSLSFPAPSLDSTLALGLIDMIPGS